MSKFIVNNVEMVKLQRGDKSIIRPMTDYKLNKKMYDFRGFKIYEAEVKTIKEEVKKPKRRSAKKD